MDAGGRATPGAVAEGQGEGEDASPAAIHAVIPAKAGIQGLIGIAAAILTALLRLPRRERVTFLCLCKEK
jgi:hypothetical protein